MRRLPLAELAWQLELPWWRLAERPFALRPADVIRAPGAFPEHARRIRRADLSYPLDMTRRKGRLIVMDGVHRLAKATIRGDLYVTVRIVPASMLALVTQR